MSGVLNADLCIIGAGSGGLSLAAGAAQLGRKVVLCERGEMGGDCLNTGCVPSKALIAAAKAAAAHRRAGIFGVHAPAPEIDFAAVMDHVRSVIAGIAPHDSQERFEGLGVTVIREHASFAGPREIKAGEHTIKAKHIVIATGSSPAIPPIEGLHATPYLTNETIFDLNERPRRLIIIGGGPIGCELAQAFRRLGSEVALIEAQMILGKEDAEATEIIRAALVADGVEVHENAAVTSVSGSPDSISVSIGEQTVSGSHLLVATGRQANVEGLNLEAAGIAATSKGIDVDARLRTSSKRVYAIGDAAGGAQFTHVAGDHASTVIRNILFKTIARRRDAIAPRVTYTDPEVASIGVTPNDAAERADLRVVRWEFSDNDRARTERDETGFAKIVADKKGRILGGVIVGHNAGDHLQPLALAVANGMKVAAFTKLIAPYPTRGEVLKRAAGAWYTPTLFSDRTRALVRILSMFD